MKKKKRNAPPSRKKKHSALKLALTLVIITVIFVAYILSINSIVNKSVVIEAGTAIPDVDEFIRSDKYAGEYLSDLNGIDTAVPGSYDLQVKVRGRAYWVTLLVSDTTPPTAEPKANEIWMGDSIEASRFASDASDISTISYSFKQAPDLTKAGLQEVVILMTDASGNSTELAADLTILKDEEAPVLTGVVDRSVYIGDSIPYKKDITVTDNHDAEVALEIDNSAVNLGAAGQYEIIYSATDSAGNRAEVKAMLTVKVKPANYISEEKLNVLLDEVLDEIVKPEMSDLEKISEIFYWIAGHIDYTGTSDKSDWVRGAYLGITRGTGDCFNYYATARALLTRAGYECIPVERVAAAKTRHYWNLVKYNGEYYHFDPLPELAHYHYVCLLRTDAEVAAFTKTKAYFYEFEKTGIPATATVPLDIERKVIVG
ncbi:MAG: transglutaminase domain-containing protein [Saccharofermentanales bacterium]